MDDRDWLETRLAAASYLPDAGFTARVVAQLPKTRPAIFSLRMRILFGAGALACCLFLLQFVPFLRNADHLLTHSSASITVPTSFLTYLEQPMALWEVAGVFVLLTYAAIPLLRRWT